MGVATKMRPIPLIALVAILVLALFTGYILVWRLLYFSVLLILFSYLWARLGLSGIAAQVKKSNGYCHVGEAFDELAVVDNVSKLPKFMMKVWQNSNLPGHINRLAINLPPQGSYRWQTRVQCTLRGQYSLGPLTLEATDPFGLFRVQRNIGDSQTLLVYPATVELSVVPLVSYGEAGSTRGCWLTSGPGGVVSRVREYIPGDSRNHIHWRSTAHTGQLMVKDFDPDFARNIWVVIDMSKESLATGKTRHDIEQRVTTAASLVKHYLNNDYPVGLMTEGDDFHILSPGLGEEHYWRIMKVLALVQAEGQMSIERLIMRERKHFRSGSLVLVITSWVTEEMVAHLVKMNNAGMTAALILPDGAWSDSTVNHRGVGHHLALSSVPAYVVKEPVMTQQTS